MEKVMFEPKDGRGISCMYGKFEPGKDYAVSKEVKDALLKIPGFSEIKTKKDKKVEER